MRIVGRSVGGWVVLAEWSCLVLTWAHSSGDEIRVISAILLVVAVGRRLALVECFGSSSVVLRPMPTDARQQKDACVVVFVFVSPATVT